jgi:hypothetical protein
MFKITPIHATHELAAPKDWKSETDGECGTLHIRAGVLGDRRLLTYTSAWRPTPEELRALNNGAAVEIELVGSQPPMRVDVVGEYGGHDRAERKTVTLNDGVIGLGHDEHGVATP